MIRAAQLLLHCIWKATYVTCFRGESPLSTNLR